MTQDNFSLKDRIIEILSELKKQGDSAIKTSVTLEGIEVQIMKLVAVIEDHEKRLKNQETFQTRAMTAWGFAVMVFTLVMNKLIAFISI